MTYYNDLEKDIKRVSIFKKAIKQLVHGITYDLGTGSGILAKFASSYAKKVYAFEINPLVIKKYTQKNLDNYDNIELIEADVSTYSFKNKPDVVICEMLDTALIDEEQVLVINNVLKYVKEDTIFIPKSTYDTIQVGYSGISHITYVEDDKPNFTSATDEIKYNSVEFSTIINPNFQKELHIKIKEDLLVNSILLTTYTCLTDQLVTGPTPMLNPPLLIPIDEMNLHNQDEIIIHLEYIMGGGLNTIKANIRRIE